MKDTISPRVPNFDRDARKVSTNTLVPTAIIKYLLTILNTIQSSDYKGHYFPNKTWPTSHFKHLANNDTSLLFFTALIVTLGPLFVVFNYNMFLRPLLGRRDYLFPIS